MIVTAKRLTKGILIYLGVTLLIGVPFALVNGIWPRTSTGWILLLVLTAPVMVIGEFIGEKLFDDRISDTIDPKRKNKPEKSVN